MQSDEEKRDRELSRLKHIGAAIRSARKAKGLTLDGLAGDVGLSVTFLSRLERGQVSCSIGNLLEISSALELSPASLFSSDEDAARSNFRVSRAIDSDVCGGLGPYGWRQIASGQHEQCLESFVLDLLAGKKDTPLVTHLGEEFCYVLEGNVEFQVGDERVELHSGDSIHLRSDVPHMAWSSGKRNARLLMVTAINNQTATAVEWWAQMATKAKSPKRSRTSGKNRAVRGDV